MADERLNARATVGSGAGESYREITATYDGGTQKNALDVYLRGGSLGANYATLVDEASSTVTYIGLADVASSSASAVWQIKKMTVSGSVTAITWADGDASFDNVWDNRASLSYS